MEVCREKIPHGQKRRADDELTNDQRLVKRFNLLDLGKFTYILLCPVINTLLMPFARAKWQTLHSRGPECAGASTLLECQRRYNAA